MDRILKKLAQRLKSNVIEGVEIRFTDFRIGESKTVSVAELFANPLYVRFYPVDDQHRLFNVEVYSNMERRSKITHSSPEKLEEDLFNYIKEAKRGTTVQRLKSKAMEPIERELADIEMPTDAELDALIDEIDKDLHDRGNLSQKIDGDQCKDAVVSKTHTVKTFPTGEKLELGEKTPKKTNVVKTTLEKDGVIKTFAVGSRLKEVKEINGGPVRLNESLKGKVLIYTLTEGAVWVDKADYQQHLNNTKIKPIIKEGRITFCKLNETGDGSNFRPTNLRG